MVLPIGDYSYEIRLDGALIAVEDGRVDSETSIVASRRSADGLNRYKVEASLDNEHRVGRLTFWYSSSLFSRRASYEVVEDNLRGRIIGLAGRDEIVVKLGRFREVEAAGFVIFRALIIGHIRLRGDRRWTGRVAVIDPNTLTAVVVKQNCARRNDSEELWLYEPRMGDTEQIELDDAGRILRRRDNRGMITELKRPRSA
jgi:hypothetical protein